VPELGLAGCRVTPFAKSSFSMCIPEVVKKLKATNASAVLICGIEAHVCIQHTALALIEMGVDVHVVVDACSSRTMTDR
jgi:nicotinamidase-related amidase